LNDKKQAKFKQRATAIRRVSMVLLAFGMILIVLAGAFWRTHNSPSMNSQTMGSVENSNVQNNLLSITVLTLGSLLMVLALVGVMTSRKLLGAGSDEVKSSRYQITPGYILMIVYLMLTCFMLITMISATFLFTFFNQSPSKWMESVYFTKRPGQTTQSINNQYRALPLDFIQTNMKVVMVTIGILCGIISFVLFVSIQLMKKLLRRIERINTMI